ncbi:MAG: hypothetical protein Q8L48_20700 [Archangium sp.]|nr:hypothetical protein [Archangium sp.]
MTKLLALLRTSPKKLTAVAALVAVLLGAPSLFHGFLLDDYVHRYAVLGFPGPMSGLSLFNFASGDPATLKPFVDIGPYPWWTDLELRLVLFRPLSSALVYADEALFGDAPAWWHLHSLLWSVAFVLAGSLVLRRLTAGALFGAALVLFTFDEARWIPTAWIANRNALVAGTFALLAFALHLRWRQDAAKWAAPLSALSLAVGLCGGEAALGISGFFVAYALVEWRRGRGNGPDRSSRAESRDPHALAQLIPLACVLIPYVITYKLIGGGAHGSGIYLDPLDSPLRFLAVAPGRFAALVGNLGLALPIDVWLAAPQARPALISLGALTLAAAAVLLTRTRAALEMKERGHLDTFILGSALALVPVLATFPASRMVLVPGVGAAGVLAFVMRHLWRTKRTVLLGALVLIHVPLVTGVWLLNQAVFDGIGRKTAAAVGKTELEMDRADLRVLAITTGDAPTGLYVPIQRALLGAKLPARYWILSNAPKAHRLTRTAENALELEVIDGRFIDTVFEQVVRTPLRPFHAGDQVQLAGALVEVLAVDDWAPKKIRVTLDRSLEADDVRLLVWRDGALRRLTPPAIGVAVELPYSEGVMAAASRLAD